MKGRGEELPKTIFLVLNEEQQIQYCNIKNQKVVRRIFEWIEIPKFLKKASQKKEIGDYILSSEQCRIHHNIYWIILMERMDSCLIYRDLATGLYNRNYWEEIRNGGIPLPDRMTMVLVDIDNFKSQNDLYGHREGDRILKMVGQAIQDSMEKRDIAIHYGGDEFIILLFHKTMKETKAIIEEIRAEIRRKGRKYEKEIMISAGIACSGFDDSIESMFQLADQRMYQEKRKKIGRKFLHLSY